MSEGKRKRPIAERVQEALDPSGDGPPPPDARQRSLEFAVALVLGTGFWRLVVSDSWVASAVFGVLLAGVLLGYGLFREQARER